MRRCLFFGVTQKNNFFVEGHPHLLLTNEKSPNRQTVRGQPVICYDVDLDLR